MIWYPYQQMKTMQTPYEIVDAEGVYLYTRERRMIDSVSSWWSVIHGYKHPALNQVLVDQAGRFSHVMLGGLTHAPAQQLAEKLGHTIIPMRPSLVALTSDDEDCPAMQGLSLRNCGVTVTDNEKKKKPVYTDFGELLFTHFGLSGPTILSASAHMRHMAPGRYTVTLDLKPALTPEQLDQRLLRDLEKNKNRNFSNSLDELLPQKMIPVVVRRSGIPPEEKCNTITREQRAVLLDVLKHFTVEISGFAPLSGAIVTAGGVSVKEVDPKTMQSKLIPGLYFAGEILDVDAYTGGFNLQIAFATGHAAGENL